MKRPMAFSLVALGLTSSLALLVPASLPAQVRDVGTGTNPAAAAPDHTGLLDTGDEADRVIVIGSLDAERNNIVPNLGATSYGISQNQLANQSQGEDAPFNQTLLRVPGFAQDSYGQLHVRGEHANLQFRINDVILPEGIAGFGQELDTRIVDSLQVVTGSLPAQYGINTAGIIDIHTKSGAFNQRRRDRFLRRQRQHVPTLLRVGGHRRASFPTISRATSWRMASASRTPTARITPSTTTPSSTTASATCSTSSTTPAA